MERIDKIIENELRQVKKELSEKQGVPEQPKKAADKRKATWNKDHPDYDWEKDVEPTVKKMKKHPDKIDNAYALRQWQILPKFKKEREKAAEKAAASRK